MKRLILLTSALALFAFVTKAQNKVDNAVNKANNAVNSANNSVNNASATASNAVNTAQNTATQVKGLGDQVNGMFGKKKTPVLIKVPGANRAKIKDLAGVLKTINGIDAKDVDYDDSAQTITIAAYKGKLNDLLDEIEKKAPQITDNNASTSKADNSITITGL